MHAGTLVAPAVSRVPARSRATNRGTPPAAVWSPAATAAGVGRVGQHLTLPPLSTHRPTRSSRPAPPRRMITDA